MAKGNCLQCRRWFLGGYIYSTMDGLRGWGGEGTYDRSSVNSVPVVWGQTKGRC